jgi:serine kinase of HPr protein (carbohydrate metabolism regulator)
MNLIMNKTRNSLHSINVDKLMFIYMNKRTFDRLKNTKSKLQFADLNIEKTNLCEMKNRLLQEEISLTSTTFIIAKRSISQTIMSDA